MLHSEPSLSIYNTDQNQDYDDRELGKSGGLSERSATIADKLEALYHHEFTYSTKMGLIEKGVEEEEKEDEKINRLSGLVAHLETGGESEKPAPCISEAGVGKDLDKNGDLGDYYMRILKGEPAKPLFLGNYAQFLQCQGDLPGAEEYYYRATLAYPKDGEILMQYAKLLWELHRDQDKASTYFEKAVSASSNDSHIQAAYARFLWEIEDSEEEDDSSANNRTPIVTHESVAEDQERPLSSPLHLAVGIGLDARDLGNGLNFVNYAGTSSDDKGNIEDYCKRMIEENPRDPLYLRNYAEFLYQSKGDLAGAEEYYLRATLVDPTDGETISQYAKLIWQLHLDKDKATTYFELAVQASPENSDVLGAYAKFLWEVEEDEE